MRTKTIALALGCVLAGGFAAQALAGSHTERADDRARWRLEDRLAVLELEVTDLRAGKMEYVAAFQASLALRADRLERVARDARKQGFTSGAISTKSRITLIEGIEEFAGALRASLPEMGDEAKARQTQLAEAMRNAQSRRVMSPPPAAQKSPGPGAMPPETAEGEDVDGGAPSEEGDG